MAALSVSKIRLSDVQKALGYFPNSVGGVCKYSGINKWSRYKPFRSAALDYGNYNQLLEGLRAANFGLTWGGGDTEDSFVYQPPTGGASSPYRLGDFRGYSNYQECRLGAASPSISITPDNFDGYTPLSPLDSEPYGIGYAELAQLFINAGAGYLYFQLDRPVACTYLDTIRVNLGCFYLGDTQKFILMSNRMMCKLGRTDDGPGTIRAFLRSASGDTTVYVNPGFTFQKTGVYSPQFTVGNIDPSVQAWNRSTAAADLRIGTGPSMEETDTFEHYSLTEYGSPVYLDLTNAQRLYIYTSTMVATPETPLTQENVFLRITDWLRRKEWYVTLRSGASLEGWTLNGGSGFYLGQSLEYFAGFETGFCGFSLVYRVNQAGYDCIPLTKELFCRVIWPESLPEPMNIFDEDGPAIG